MRFLLTNDDGIYSEGLRVLAQSLHGMGEIYIVAPDRERSGTGHGITFFKPIMTKKIELPDIAEAAWVINGTPADCVKLGIGALLPGPPDLVISGINRGSNLGTDVLYSGTVSAAVEGIIMGVPSIAVSLTSFDSNSDYSFAGRFTRLICRLMLKKIKDNDIVVNINIPAVPREKIKGVRITRLGTRRYENEFQEREDPRGNTYYWLGGDLVQEDQEKDSDVNAIAEGYVSITPIHFDLTDYNLINRFRELFKHKIDPV